MIENTPEETVLFELPGMKRKLLPMQDYLQIESSPPKKVGELFLPEMNASMQYLTATVIACGPDCKRVKEGMSILFSKQALLAIPQVTGGVIQMTKEDKILAIVEGEMPEAPAQ